MQIVASVKVAKMDQNSKNLNGTNDPSMNDVSTESEVKSIKLERPRRLRKNAPVRNAVAETHLSSAHLIQPIFVAEKTEDILSMPGQQRLSLKDLEQKALRLQDLGLFGVALFSKVKDENKNSLGSYALEDSLYFEAIQMLKERTPNLQVVTDLALDPYSTTGHDGVVAPDGRILNDETCEILSYMALKHAEMGADFVAPSDMMDGRVYDIRVALELGGYTDVGIISYSAKYASAFYGPFRDALDSAPKSGDKKTYQMDPANSKEALKEAQLDVAEGADFVMIKPAGPYLDIISKIEQNISVPVAAYQVSGEYSALCAAFEKGWLNKDQAIHESLIAIRRAGASLIFSYFAEYWSQNKSK